LAFAFDSEQRTKNSELKMDELLILTRFNSLEIKLKGLLKDYIEVKKQLIEVKEDNEKLRIELYDSQKENQELQKNLNQERKNFKKSDKFTKIAVNNLKSTGNPAELKEKIDEYILEIEKCINQLSN
jgi:predicted  nucleic acid-binding Zn-ribbon protein